MSPRQQPKGILRSISLAHGLRSGAILCSSIFSRRMSLGNLSRSARNLSAVLPASARRKPWRLARPAACRWAHRAVGRRIRSALPPSGRLRIADLLFQSQAAVGTFCPVALRLRSLDRLIKAHVAMGTVRRHGAAPHPRVCRFETRHAQGFTAFRAWDVEQAPKRCDWHHRDHYRARKPDNEISGGDAYQYSRHNEKVGRTANVLAAPSHEKFADSHRSLLVHRLIKAHAAEGTVFDLQAPPRESHCRLHGDRLAEPSAAFGTADEHERDDGPHEGHTFTGSQREKQLRS